MGVGGGRKGPNDRSGSYGIWRRLTHREASEAATATATATVAAVAVVVAVVAIVVAMASSSNAVATQP
ncbi:hypothetical protein HZH66_003271 [Vespula vulgaris]|uniref:Uncharacterized protein n=1 Tax=Vespula vulgaris TaxID=7454 RepID=A0A836XMK1_VESVU|nr:hypothetical protein HZH66_003271 [Vespula vulgaris]